MTRRVTFLALTFCINVAAICRFEFIEHKCEMLGKIKSDWVLL